LGEEEYTVLHLLDGRTSLDELRAHCERAVAPRQLSVQQMQGFLATLHQFGLLQSDSPGQGEQLLGRRNKARRRRCYESLASVLAIRFPGVNPRRLLDGLDPLLGWIFSPYCVGLVMLLALSA